MGARGPKSKNVGCLGLAPPKKRPKPPRYLPKRAKALWRQIVDSLPPDYFRGSELTLLEKYVWAEEIYHQAMEAVKAFGLVVTMGRKGYQAPNPALVICNKQVALMSTLATKLRLCPNSRVTKWKAGTAPERKHSGRSGLMFGEDED